MSTGKLLAVAVILFLGWQQQTAIAAHLGPLQYAVPRVRTYLEMNRYESELKLMLQRGEQPPRNISAWLDERYLPELGRPASRDLFGNLYRLDRDRTHGWVLRSCGPDALCLTEDDLIKPLQPGA
jgi:hypothetical protein